MRFLVAHAPDGAAAAGISDAALGDQIFSGRNYFGACELIRAYLNRRNQCWLGGGTDG